jgi:hypothetical protein
MGLDMNRVVAFLSGGEEVPYDSDNPEEVAQFEAITAKLSRNSEAAIRMFSPSTDPHIENVRRELYLFMFESMLNRNDQEAQ